MRFKFFWKTIVRMLLLLVSVSMLSFFLVTYSPIDPIDAYLGEARISEEQRDRISEEWGLNKSPVERYVIWGEHILYGHSLGTYWRYRFSSRNFIWQSQEQYGR